MYWWHPHSPPPTKFKSAHAYNDSMKQNDIKLAVKRSRASWPYRYKNSPLQDQFQKISFLGTIHRIICS